MTLIRSEPSTESSQLSTYVPGGEARGTRTKDAEASGLGFSALWKDSMKRLNNSPTSKTRDVGGQEGEAGTL